MPAHSASAITDEYENWMRSRLTVREDHLEEKHKKLRETKKSSAFQFLRGTFYLWAKRVHDEIPDAVGDNVPVVVGLGDTHLENFGTWRDAEGRLVWGANDLDEATRMPYMQDLVRLATSATLSELKADEGAAAEAIQAGYRRRLIDGPQPFVLAELDRTLRPLVEERPTDQGEWWTKKREDFQAGAVDGEVTKILLKSLPVRQVNELEWGTRQAGVGSLGRPRIVLFGRLYGSFICREAKAVLPSAWDWSNGRLDDPPLAGRLLASPYRAKDPFAAVRSGWSVRRLAPDSEKIEIDKLKAVETEEALLDAMGGELANVHLAGGDRQHLLSHLPHGHGWLTDAATTMAESVRRDHADYVQAA